MPRALLFLTVVVGFFAVNAGVVAENSDYADKRLSRSMELYRLETGLDSPEVRAVIAARDARISKLQQEANGDLAFDDGVVEPQVDTKQSVSAYRSRGADCAPAGAKRTSKTDNCVPTREFVLTKGVLDESIRKLLKEGFGEDSDGYTLVWNAPHYDVPADMHFRANDPIDVLEQILASYRREGVALEASIFALNTPPVVAVSIGGYRQPDPTKIGGTVGR